MTSVARRRQYGYDEYLALEEFANVKHEFLDGEIYAMAGGTPEHAALAAEVLTSLTLQLRGKSCRTYSSDLHVRVSETGLATYPDVTVVCDKPKLDPEGKNTVVNPTVIVEVLSPSTASYDRTEKREHYQRIPTLKELVLVAHDERKIEVYRRPKRGRWSHVAAGPGASITLTSIECLLDVDAIYSAAGL
ncbi:MAG: Uma2 family endonuclease [Sandaracinaceae bacterium]|nr:Uma2 family endonuclease [Sandaracinaceae bacterium]